MSGFLGSGDLYMDRFDEDGNSTGFLQVGNATKLAITEGGEIKERKSRMRDTYGQVLDSVPIKDPARISITLDDLMVHNLAIALLGDTAALSITGSSVTDEEITSKHDKWVQLDYRKVSSVVVTGSGGTPSYTEGTDYEVHADLGMIKALSTGSIPDDTTIEVDYSYATRSGTTIKGSERPIVKCALKLEGENQVTEKDVILEVWEAVLQPAQEVDFLNPEYNELLLEGTLNTPTGQTNPYEVEYMS